MAKLTNEEREALVRTSVWNGIGTGIGVAIAGGLIMALHKIWDIIRAAEQIVENLP